jgi:hypothetical protein
MGQLLACLGTLLLSLAFSSCVVRIGGCSGAPYVHGSGVPASEERALAEFDRIEISGAFRLVVRGGEPRSVVLRGDDNLLEFVRTRVRDGRLLIDTHGARFTSALPIEVEVGVPTLRGLEVSGSSRFDLQGLGAEQFSVAVSGSANGQAAGRVGTLNIDISGSARLEFFELLADEVDLRVSGSARVNVHAERRLAARISGSGEVRYRGQPEVRTSLSGSGWVRPAGL